MPELPDRHPPAASSPELLAPADLPPADTRHWVARRKARVVEAVQCGLLSLEEALSRYKLSLEEFTGWQRALYRHGVRGLQIGHSQLQRVKGRLSRHQKKGEARHA